MLYLVGVLFAITRHWHLPYYPIVDYCEPLDGMCLWLIKMMVRWLYFMVSGILISFSNEYSLVFVFIATYRLSCIVKLFQGTFYAIKSILQCTQYQCSWNQKIRTWCKFCILLSIYTNTKTQESGFNFNVTSCFIITFILFSS